MVKNDQKFKTATIFLLSRLQFEVALFKLPREMRLCMTLVGIRYNTASDKTQGADSAPKPQIVVPIGAAAIQLYNQRG